jgi:hypothetical protein
MFMYVGLFIYILWIPPSILSDLLSIKVALTGDVSFQISHPSKLVTYFYQLKRQAH